MDIDKINMGPQLSMQIGVPMRLEIDGISIPVESAFVGVEENYLILRAPNPYNLVEHKIFKGAELIVKYISHGTVFAFQSKVYGNITEPIKLLVLEYPKIVQKHELRKQRRTKCYIPVTVKVNDNEMNGAIVDITKKGCRCLISKPLENKKFSVINIDNKVELNCKFPGIKGKIPLAGKIKNIKKCKKEFDLGIMFSSDSKKESVKIVSWYVTTIEDYIDDA